MDMDGVCRRCKIQVVVRKLEHHYLVAVCTSNAYGSKVVDCVRCCVTLNAQDAKCGLYLTQD